MFREMARIKQQISDEECIEILKKQLRGVLSFPPPFDFDRRAAAFCEERGIFFSVINAKIYGGEYDCALFAELMEDWK